MKIIFKIQRPLTIPLFLFLIFANPTQSFASRAAGDLAAAYLPETPALGRRPLQTNFPVDWSQPPLGCVEEMIPHAADRPCLDLTTVASPLSDWPSGISQADHDFWYGQRRGLTYCRASELLRREALQPESQSAGSVEISWMSSVAVNDYAVKVRAIYDASDLYGVPAHVLTGAVYQESLFAELGISADGGNYSCGVEQINLTGWCSWANKQSAADKSSMGWPLPTVDCGDTSLVNPSFLKPFYTIALTRLNGLPEYRLQKSHFQNIGPQDVSAQWPPADDAVNAQRYTLARSFIDNCSDPRLGILAKADSLQSLYNNYIPNAFKNKDRYSGAERFSRQCLQTAKDDAFPLHAGWVMAVGAYNAGPRSIDAVTYYNQWSPTDFNDPSVVQDFTPDKIIESIYWSGKYNSSLDRIDFADVNGSPRHWIWYAGCVNQRHVARVMQNVTLIPEFFVDSLEGQFPCAPSTTDANGNVVTSVPPARQISSGVISP